jgi:site-specific recombinase XerD
MYIPVDIDYAVKRELRRRRSSERTAKSYLYWIHRFLKHSGKTLDKASKKDVREFLYSLDEKKLAGNTLNVAHMAIRFLFEEVLDKRIWIDVKYSKIPKRIQRHLTKEEVERLIKAVKNPKHRLMVALLYSAGLRVSELVHLRIEDLRIPEKYGFVRNGKGGKDRIFVIADRIEIALSAICEGRESREGVFVSNRGEKYSVASIQKIVRNAARKAGIEDYKEVHPHTLRHSFATHLVENNYSITDVQASLGHKSPETSMIYTHSSGKLIGIRSPLDSCNQQI